ncbi:hypothetical protein G6F57_002832 [Rhizopus arrhizus]|uniref:Tc1-like transposase DDE domain-containing protein n=1 Tax=Rhizopus oryzae TaxID=64495 RepID=A0A9P6XBK4_RHIOR|nr:hypothetical protein G6F23_009596 [Rhizopus arrhizus]KAG0767760.1 hypothetical protein G6F24_002506 [Rhizopus arrhizus]KAG0812870.1 hypothetical protein G6F20_006017 [Rhizopus arrhizus]KAG0832724.1 hypothetical protein G6F19_006063 [Rhizopus arrhizus]KAG0838883.1 hypothetical protein G6F18_004320 [Rhizopus arrhizus]
MSTKFLYEDGHGNVVDENGGPEPMDYIVDQEEFIVETIATHTDYLKNTTFDESSLTCPMLVDKSKDEDILMKEAKTKRDYVRYTVQDKARFFDLKIEKCMSASTAAKQLGIHIRTAQRWVKQYSMCPDNIFDSYSRVGRKCILTEEHKRTIVNFIDDNPSATVVEVAEHLLKRFDDLKVSRSTVYNFMRGECNLSLKKADFQSIERNSQAKIEERHNWVCKWEHTDMNFLTNCVFLDESAFDINMKRSRAWSTKGTRAIVTRPTTRANTTSILGAISAAGLITVGVKKPRPVKKRKAEGYISSGTVTGHYISFLKITLDEMDKYPHMKGHYIVMDNAPIHTHENIKKYIEFRGYKCVYLPTYSPELNPIEQFWAVAKKLRKPAKV